MERNDICIPFLVMVRNVFAKRGLESYSGFHQKNAITQECLEGGYQKIERMTAGRHRFDSATRQSREEYPGAQSRTKESLFTW